MVVGTLLRSAKLDLTYDVIVIGSGMGGLTTASLLAQKGQKVLVLERHYTAGGFTHSFKRKSYEWDVGVHYIGEVHNPRSAWRTLFNRVTQDAVQWAKMEPVYDRIYIGNETYDFVSGRQRFYEKLLSYFPKEEKALKKYFTIINEIRRSTKGFFVKKLLPLPMSNVLSTLLGKQFQKYAQLTTREVLSSFTSNDELIGVLCSQWGDYGVPPAQSSFAMHALVVNHYLEGASYPVGGASSIARSIEPIIEASGGKVIVQAEVDSILIQKHQAIGVKLKNGTEIRAKTIVSGVGVLNTYQRLLPKTVADEIGILSKLKAVEPSLSHLALYIGLGKSAEDLRLGQSNLWIYPGYDHDGNMTRYLSNPQTPLPVVYISFPSAKDPDWKNRHPGSSTVEVISFAPFQWVEKWNHTSWKRRGKEYDSLKARFSERLLESLYRYLPQVKGEVDHSELSTPLSTQHFSNYAQGEIYGLSHTPARFAQKWLTPKTPVKNLYLTGQDIATAGVVGALAAGAMTTMSVLGFRKSRDVSKILWSSS